MHTPQMPSSFAFATKPDANSERNTQSCGVNGPESNNVTLCHLRVACDICSAPLTASQQGNKNRFCSHACYSSSLRLPVEPRFWSHVNKNGPIHHVLGTRCWLWTANVVGHGSKYRPAHSRHGQFTYRRDDGTQAHVFAHRFAWELARGPIPDGVQVLHRCDVAPCVFDDHLFLGTHADNMKDAASKNRLTVPRDRTLSLFDRLTIYHTPDYPGVVVNFAREYRVTKACISLIRSGRFLGSGVWNGTKNVSNQEESA